MSLNRGVQEDAHAVRQRVTSFEIGYQGQGIRVFLRTHSNGSLQYHGRGQGGALTADQRLCNV